jgi:AhpD family alkylhydroperoxidase
MTKNVGEWKKERLKLNEIVLERKHQGILRFFNLDNAAYRDGALSAKTKEMLGLSASLVLRCDDCITYHVIQCVDAGVTDEEFDELFNVGLVVGGSIVIPHLRRAYRTLKEIREGG